MATPFSEIENMFLSDITDDTFLDYEETDRQAILDSLRIKAITRFKACKVDLSDKDETLKQFNQTLTDEEKLIIATCMRKYWFNDKLYSLDLIRQRMSSKDWKQTSQAEHLLRLTVLNQELDKEITNMIISYTVYNYKVGE
jgi:hypothetical protein